MQCYGTRFDNVSASWHATPPEVHDYIKRGKATGDHIQRLKLSEFIAQPCVVTHGTSVSRRVVIKYIANKLGGAHYDKNRSDSAGALFRMLDKIEYRVAEKPPVYFELLATAHALVASDDIQKILDVSSN